MGQYVDMETGEIIDVAQVRREQARIVGRQKHTPARKSRIYRYVREAEPQTMRRFVRSIPRLLWDKHYGEIIGV
jgi:hypothetical protein